MSHINTEGLNSYLTFRLADSHRMYGGDNSSNGGLVENENRLNANLCTCPREISRACGNCNGFPPPTTPRLSIVIQGKTNMTMGTLSWLFTEIWKLEIRNFQIHLFIHLISVFRVFTLLNSFTHVTTEWTKFNIMVSQNVKGDKYLDLNLNACPIFSDSGEHCHDDEQQFKADKVARRKLWIASVLCVIFMIGEAVGKHLTLPNGNCFNWWQKNNFGNFTGGVLAGSLAVGMF